MNKTERQLSVKLSDSNKPVTIGEYSSKSLLLGVFIKNEPYGLKNMKELLPQKQKELIDIIINYFNELFDTGVKSVRLYEEADRYGK